MGEIAVRVFAGLFVFEEGDGAGVLFFEGGDVFGCYGEGGGGAAEHGSAWVCRKLRRGKMVWGGFWVESW